eukprot:5736134-Prymnesium_polylepis.1
MSGKSIARSPPRLPLRWRAPPTGTCLCQPAQQLRSLRTWRVLKRMRRLQGERYADAAKTRGGRKEVGPGGGSMRCGIRERCGAFGW